MKKKSLCAEELSYFNAIACLMVIFVHVVSYGIACAPADSVRAALIYFPWCLALCVVPAFLFSSAAKMGRQYQEDYSRREYVGYIAGRVKKIFLPYVGWNLIYYAVLVSVEYYALSAQDFLVKLFSGTMFSQFYYIVVAMQFYLLKPVWFWIVKNVRWYVAVPAAVLVSYFSAYLNAFLKVWDTSFPYTDRIFTTYLVFWIVGLYAGRHWEQVTESVAGAGKSVAVGAGVVLLAAVIPYLQHSRGIRLIDFAYHRVITDLLSIFILLWVCLKLRGAKVWLKRCLMFISEASFSVYLSHCLFLATVEYLLEDAGVSEIGVALAIRALVCYTVPFALYVVMARVRAVVGDGLAKIRKA